MAIKKGISLPGSLDLLLDTMCNTFGGIVFIAIALVIITQISSKKVMEEPEHPATPEEIAELKQKLDDAQEALNEIKGNNMANFLKSLGLPVDAVGIIVNISAQQDKNAGLFTDVTNAQNSALEAEAKNIEQQTQNNIDKANAESMLEDAKMSLASLKNGNQAMQERLDSVLKSIDILKGKAKNAKPLQTLTFAMEQETGSRKQYNIYIKNGNYYTQENTKELRSHGAVVVDFSSSGSGWSFSMLTGELSRKPTGGYFVSLWSDANSYDALLAIREWLRNRGFLVSWSCVSEFSFSTGESGPNASY